MVLIMALVIVMETHLINVVNVVETALMRVSVIAQVTLKIVLVFVVEILK